MIAGRIGGFSSPFHPGLLLTRRASSNRPGRGVIIPRVQTLISWNTFPSAAEGAPAASLVIAVPDAPSRGRLPPLARLKGSINGGSLLRFHLTEHISR